MRNANLAVLDHITDEELEEVILKIALDAGEGGATEGAGRHVQVASFGKWKETSWRQGFADNKTKEMDGPELPANNQLGALLFAVEDKSWLGFTTGERKHSMAWEEFKDSKAWEFDFWLRP